VVEGQRVKPARQPVQQHGLDAVHVATHAAGADMATPSGHQLQQADGLKARRAERVQKQQGSAF
jgi:hypothetical protein